MWTRRWLVAVALLAAAAGAQAASSAPGGRRALNTLPPSQSLRQLRQETTVNCTAISPPIARCAEALCSPIFQLRRLESGEIECQRILDTPVPPEGDIVTFDGTVEDVGVITTEVSTADALDTLFGYDYDYLFNFEGAAVLTGASLLNRITTGDEGVSSVGAFGDRTFGEFVSDLRTVPNPFIGTKTIRTGLVQQANALTETADDVTQPFTYTGISDVSASAATTDGVYIPGTTYSIRESDNDENNVAIDVGANWVFPFLLG